MLKNVPLKEDESRADAEEIREWIESLEAILAEKGPERVRQLLEELTEVGRRAGIPVPFNLNTPYINTIPASEQPPFPGDRETERRIKSLIRWNALAMVVRANRESPGIGGHISTYASSATLFEVGFNHFFHGKDGTEHPGDQVFIQGHAAPGIYARAFLEGRITVEQMENFRRELSPGGGLSSYPHPWLMPGFWEFPSVSMGLVPIMAIYQARFNRYLEDRGIKGTQRSKIWAFLGDGETDEPETLGALTLASREKLDNLIFVINCNLQRLDGPVRGNGKIIQELEAAFRGAGWNVIKVIWGEDWDPLLDKDQQGLLVKRMTEVVDGQYQKYVVAPGSYTRKDFFGAYPELLEMVKHYSDERIRKLKRGGHDPEKVYAAYKSAAEHRGSPTVILAKTVKGYGLGEAGEGKNITHQQKKLNETELREFRSRFGIPISDDEVGKCPFYRPSPSSVEVSYLMERRKELGGFIPSRTISAPAFEAPTLEVFKELLEGTEGREVSTTMAFVRALTLLLKLPEIGRLIVPIIPDEARTFGMDALFRQVGIYSHIGQLYEPVDQDKFLYYREDKAGQILEEGITEAGAISSFIAAGTAYATHGVNTIPFFAFYSMFGFQRIGDLIWAASDMRTKGFLMGGTAGRTTLAGEGLQHQDGHSHLNASAFPSVMAYDPAFAYEIAVIIRDGIRRMYQEKEDIFYYITMGNENYPMPPMAAGIEEGILKGLYRLNTGEAKKGWPRVQLLGSGALLREALRAQTILAEKYSVAADVWSVTSYKELRREALEAERLNLLKPNEPAREPYVKAALKDAPGPFIAVSDYVRAVPEMISRWVPSGLYALGTDGFGRSDTRQALRRFFEVDAEAVVLAALSQLAERNQFPKQKLKDVPKALGLDPDKASPIRS